MARKNKVFFDTNVLVYQFDQSDPIKQNMAIDLIERHIFNKEAVVSLQVVQEFINVALGKFSKSLSVPELELVLSDLLRPLWAHVPNFEFYERAIKLYSKNRIGFYDSLIVQAAIDLGCITLYSEDLQDGQRFETVVVKNPFA